MYSLALTIALTAPGDPLSIQDARLVALEAAILNTTPSCMDVSGPGYGHYVRAIELAIFARRDVERWRFAPVYYPFGFQDPITGLYLWSEDPTNPPDYLDQLLQKAEYHLDRSDDPCR